MAFGSNGMMLLLRCASSIRACMCRSIAWRSSSSFFASSCRVCVVWLLLRLVHRVTRRLPRFLQRSRALLGLAFLHMQSELPHHVLRLRHGAVGTVADQIVVGRAEIEEGAQVAGEQLGLLHQPIQPLQRIAAVVRMDAEGFARGDQHAGDRIVEWPLRQFEGRVRAGAGLPGASRPTRRPITGSPAQGCAVRSGWLMPCADFG